MKTLNDLKKYSCEQRPGLAERLQARRPRLKVVEALVKLRRMYSLSQRALAERAGIPQPTVARLESMSEDRIQTTEKIVEYAEACGVHVGLVFVAKDDDQCAILETVSLSDDEAVRHFMADLPNAVEARQINGPNSNGGSRQATV